jgi:hypothetical protein
MPIVSSVQIWRSSTVSGWDTLTTTHRTPPGIRLAVGSCRRRESHEFSPVLPRAERREAGIRALIPWSRGGSRASFRSCALPGNMSHRVSPGGDDGQSLRASCQHQASVERDKRDGLSKLPLQVQAARKLDGVARAERMSKKQGSRVRGNLRGHLHFCKSGYVSLEGVQHPVALRHGERPFPSTSDDPRRYLHLGKPACRDGPRGEQAADLRTPALSDVPLHEHARIEVASHTRSSRLSTMASDTEGPRLRTGRNGASGRFSGRATVPIAFSRSRTASSVPAPWRGFSSATGSPRSVMASVRPCRTCCR